MPETLDYSDLKTILFVDDEAALRTLFFTILKSNGYSVIVAADGQEALALARRYDRVIHLLLSDFVIPGITGAELAERLRPV